MTLPTACAFPFGSQAWMLLAAEEAPKPLEYRVDLSIFTLVIFLVLMFLLWRYAWKPISSGLEKREKSIADSIQQAQQAQQKAEATLRQYDEKLAAAAGEAAALLAEAKKEAQRARERIVAEANDEAQRQRQRAIADITAAKDQAVRELAQRSVDTAVALAGQLIHRELDAQTHSQLIQESLDRLASGGRFSKN